MKFGNKLGIDGGRFVNVYITGRLVSKLEDGGFLLLKI